MHFYCLLFGRVLRFMYFCIVLLKNTGNKKVQQKCIYESICANIQNKKI